MNQAPKPPKPFKKARLCFSLVKEPIPSPPVFLEEQ